MSDKVGSGIITSVLVSYYLSDVTVSGKFFTAYVHDEDEVNDIKNLEIFDIKLSNDRILVRCEINDYSKKDKGYIIKGHYEQFE